jgi:Tfp pilus assembly protein PilN
MSVQAAEQQVNLYQPILGAEKHLFSARAIGVALALLVACLGGLVFYVSWRTARIEHAVVQLQRQEQENLDVAERAGTAARGSLSMPQLDAEAKELMDDIEIRQRVLDVVHRGSVTPANGFAARLEALAHRQLDGIWLNTVILGSGDGRLSMRGATTDSRLLPAYLSALTQETALTGVRFDRLSMRRALPTESPASTVFELVGPGLSIPKAEEAK